MLCIYFYFFPLLIVFDLWLNKALSSRLDEKLDKTESPVLQAIIIVVAFIGANVWGINYGNTIAPSESGFGIMYPIDKFSICIAIIPTVMYVFYYYALELLKIYQEIH